MKKVKDHLNEQKYWDIFTIPANSNLSYASSAHCSWLCDRPSIAATMNPNIVGSASSHAVSALHKRNPIQNLQFYVGVFCVVYRLHVAYDIAL